MANWLSANDWLSLGLTLQLAISVTLVLILLCLPLAFALAHWRSPFKPIIEAITTLPLILPPTVLGYYLLVAFAPTQPLGAFYKTLFNQQLAFSYQGIFIASLLYSLPFALRPLQSAFEQQGKPLLDSARCYGFTPTQAFFRILLPNIRPALLSAATLCFAHTVGEFGVVLMIGGNIPGETQVLSIALFDHVENLDYTYANRLAFMLLIFSFAVVLLSQWLMRGHSAFEPALLTKSRGQK